MRKCLAKKLVVDLWCLVSKSKSCEAFFALRQFGSSPGVRKLCARSPSTDFQGRQVRLERHSARVIRGVIRA